ncbi:TolC family protein [Planctomicrobium sp. SH664]|uniref:TolC family protein n=1 Tax=Planctomicrobium sp. SH664 TaxID=3448125 RepID=UPI003F5ADE19
MTSSHLRTSRVARCLSLLAGSAMLLGNLAGCSRTFWRDQADRDSYEAITEKLNNPLWNLPRIDLTPDPRSRFYDPFNPDCEPLPPDDPAAHVFMHWVDGWEGYKGWHKFGDLMSVENPQWMANLGLSTDLIDPLTGEYVAPVPALKGVTLPEAVELAQINNRDYQFQIESVYLAALAVTFQRFQFGVRYLTASGVEPTAGAAAFFTPHGAPDGGTGNVRGGVSQLLPAGTQYAVEFANNTLWLFSGGSATRSMSTLSFSIVQPLLFGAGRKVGLEGLTQAERALLYQARVLARFRQQLFTDVVGGPSGYLVLLQDVQQITNARGNVKRLQEQVDRLLAESARNKQFASVTLEQPVDIPPELATKLAYEGDPLYRLYWRSPDPVTDAEIEMMRNLRPDPEFHLAVDNLINLLKQEVATLDVLNLQSQLANSINSLRASERVLQDDLDNFKLLLGLPTDMELTIDDDLLIPFQLIDPRLTALEDQGKAFVEQWEALNTDNPDLATLHRSYEELQTIVRRVQEEALSYVRADLAGVRAALPKRLAMLAEEADRIQLQKDISRAELLYEEAERDLDQVLLDVQAIGAMLRTEPPASQPGSEEDPDLVRRRAIYQDIGMVREDVVRLAQNLAVVQLSMRVELIEVQPFEIAMQNAIATAMENRLDLMNARAQVMDARRRVEIAANALQSALSVVVEGDFNTPNTNTPFEFRGDQSQIRAGLQFTAPLDQIDERNAYRIAQINYQRQRRAYMLFEDQVKQQVRVAWRQLFVLKQNLETSRRAVRLAALQYDNAVNQSAAPGSVNSTTSSSSGSGLQGNNLNTALSQLLNAQNQLIGNYISYERNRLNIYRDMGIMDIMEDGMWNDAFYRSELNEQSNQPRGPSADLDAPGTGDAGTGYSRLGGRVSEDGLVAVPERGVIRQVNAERHDPGAGYPWAVSDHAVGSGESRQPEKRHPDQPRGRLDNDYQHRPGRNDGEIGRSGL